jgi:type I restriction enzyme S subunit
VNPQKFHPSSIKFFDNKISSTMDRISNNLCDSRALATIRDTRIPKFLSGELRVPDAVKIIEVIV